MGAAALVTACGGSDPGPGPDEKPIYLWSFHEYRKDGLEAAEVAAGIESRGSVFEQFDFGFSLFTDDFFGTDGIARGEVFGNASGKSFATYAEAPLTVTGEVAEPVGGIAELTKIQSYRRDEAHASFELVITAAQVAALDGNGTTLNTADCIWIESFGDLGCTDIMRASNEMTVIAFVRSPAVKAPFALMRSDMELRGWGGNFDFQTGTRPAMDETPGFPVTQPIWHRADFDVLDGLGTLRKTKVVPIDLSSVDIGATFTLQITVKSEAFNMRQRESSIQALLRDPPNIEGLGHVRFSGLTPVDLPPVDPPPAPPVPVLPCPAGTVDAAAGTLQFGATAFAVAEWAGAKTRIVVTRSGGTRGEVSVTFTARDGTAVAGSDYTPIGGNVWFGDGDAEPRVIELPIVHDNVAEADKTVQLELSSPGGCAALGPVSSAVLTILDDDRALPSFTVGGNVTGLAGGGLVLTTGSQDLAIGTNGPFAFPIATGDGSAYAVAVKVQPNNPPQVCAVARGNGTVHGANVADVAVDCASPPSGGPFDPAFGAGGRVFASIASASELASTMTLQSDGRVVVAGAAGNAFAITRFLRDGSVDAGFGSAGLATVTLAVRDDARSVAVQPDGRIVVAGASRTTSSNSATSDFALARTLADGRPDTSFGGGRGFVRTDFGARGDEANAVLLQPDGRIVAGGRTSPAAGGVVFGLARYLTDGSIDTSFGSAGKVVTSFAGFGDVEEVKALRLQPDGAIVAIGNSHVVRYRADGTLDASFGAGGIVTALGFASHDGVVLADGRLLIVGSPDGPSTSDLGLLRLNADGSADATFGPAGIVRTDLGLAEFGYALAQRADGRIVVAGLERGGASDDFVIARFESDGRPDTGFGSGGRLVVDFFGGADSASAVALAADGAVILAGRARNGDDGGIGLVRLLP